MDKARIVNRDKNMVDNARALLYTPKNARRIADEYKNTAFAAS